MISSKVVPSGREEISTSPNSGSARDASVTMTTQQKKAIVDGVNYRLMREIFRRLKRKENLEIRVPKITDFQINIFQQNLATLSAFNMRMNGVYL